MFQVQKKAVFSYQAFSSIHGFSCSSADSYFCTLTRITGAELFNLTSDRCKKISEDPHLVQCFWFQTDQQTFEQDSIFKWTAVESHQETALRRWALATSGNNRTRSSRHWISTLQFPFGAHRSSHTVFENKTVKIRFFWFQYLIQTDTDTIYKIILLH